MRTAMAIIKPAMVEAKPLHEAGERRRAGRALADDLLAAIEPERIGIVVRRSAVLRRPAGRHRLRPGLTEADRGGEREHTAETYTHRIFPHGRSRVWRGAPHGEARRLEVDVGGTAIRPLCW